MLMAAAQPMRLPGIVTHQPLSHQYHPELSFFPPCTSPGDPAAPSVGCLYQICSRNLHLDQIQPKYATAEATPYRPHRDCKHPSEHRFHTIDHAHLCIRNSLLLIYAQQSSAQPVCEESKDWARPVSCTQSEREVMAAAEASEVVAEECSATNAATKAAVLRLWPSSARSNPADCIWHAAQVSQRPQDWTS